MKKNILLYQCVALTLLYSSHALHSSLLGSKSPSEKKTAAENSDHPLVAVNCKVDADENGYDPVALVISPAKASVAAGISYAIKSLPAVAKPSALVAKNPGLKVTTSFSTRFAELVEPVSDKDTTLINDLFEKMKQSKEANKKMMALIENDSDMHKEHLLYLHTGWSKVSLTQIQSLFLIPDASQRDAVRNKIEAEMVQQAPASLASTLSDNATHQALRKKIDAVCLTSGSVKSDDEVGQSYRTFMAQASDAAKTAFEKTASTLQITNAGQLFDHM